jgi:branched-chain amino acid transport system permease protein
MNRTKLARAVILAILLIILLVVPVIVQSSYILHLFIITGLAITLSANSRLMIKGGLWFFAQAAFYAIGAYSLLLFRWKLGLNFWVAFPLAGLVAGFIALGLGYATSRVKEIYFCIISVAFSEVIRFTIIKTPFLGSGRAVSCPPPTPFLGIEFVSKVQYYYFIFVLVSITLAGLYMIEKSRVGLILNTIAESESLAQSIGINSVRYKIATMSLCCFFIGIAGAFYAPYITVLGPTSFTVILSMMVMMYAIVGGMGSILGPVIGAAFLTALPEFLPFGAGFKNILFAAIVLLTLFFMPEGIISLPRLIRKGISGRSQKG